MAAYSRVYDTRHLQADCQERDQLRNATLGNRVWATFLSLINMKAQCDKLATEPKGPYLQRLTNDS